MGSSITTRITRGKIHIQRKRFELAELLGRIVEDHRSVFTSASVELEVRLVPKSVWVNADAARIAQAVENLLQKAAKFTVRGGHVTSALEADDSRRMAVIRVRDTGIGIGPDSLPQLFQPFMQADITLERSRGGLGLGLALVKGLVDLHGGTVDVRSEGLAKGSEFTIRLPLEHEMIVSESTASATPKSPARRVLIIEDNVDAADTLRAALEFGNHKVEVACNGQEALPVPFL